MQEFLVNTVELFPHYQFEKNPQLFEKKIYNLWKSNKNLEKVPTPFQWYVCKKLEVVITGIMIWFGLCSNVHWRRNYMPAYERLDWTSEDKSDYTERVREREKQSEKEWHW